LKSGSKRRHNYELERDHKALAARRICRQVCDKVTGIHNAIVRHFVESYAFVAIGNFRGVVKRRRAGIGRDPLNLWHVRDFQAKLLLRFDGLDNQRVTVQDEAYTSKTCGLCDFIKQNLGAAIQVFVR
jgi:transposase